MKRQLKVFVLTVLAAGMAGSVWAGTGEELYLVGDATVIGWSGDGSIRQTTRMTETDPGVYVWTGFLKNGGEGFKICDSKGGWDGYRSSSSSGVAMSGTGSDNCHKNGDDNKWNPTNTDWQCFTITLDTNSGTLSWEPGVYEVLTAGSDGYFSIGTAEDLNKLAFMYRNNINNVAYKAKLTADIDYTAYTNSSLASLGISQTYPFRGEFDGQGHTIKIALTNAGSSRTGLFAYVNAATIKNLVVEGSATSAGNNCVGGLGGRSDGSGTLIENVVVKTAVSYTGSNGDATCGGFFANMEGTATLKNCAFYGSINTGTAEGNGGLVGWAGSGSSNKYEKCIVAPTAYTQNGNSADYGRNNPSAVNCYRVANDDARLASGEMTYIMNGNSSENAAWFQKLGTDAYPMPFGTDVVYAVGDLYCDGTSKGGDLTFSNTNEANRDDHHFNEWGFCDKVNNGNLCNDLQPDFMTPNGDGYYEIGTKQQLNWFAAKVNGHKTTTGVRDINGKLTADIDFSDQTNMIGGDGNGVAYQGTFDGQGHKVTLGYAANAHNAALFRTIAGAHIMNLVTDGTISNEGGNCAGGIFGGSHGASLVENCVSYVALSRNNDGDATFGGIGAYMHDNGKIKNCAFYGSINTPSATGNGGLLGYANGGSNIAVENCIVNATAFTFSGNSVSVARNTGNVKYTYVVNAGNATQAEQKDATAAQLASGELAYTINNESESGMAWYQKLGTDAEPAPLPFVDANKVVYANGTFYCDGMPEAITYENTEKTATTAPHNYGTEWGLCTNSHDGIVCDDANPDFATQDGGCYVIDSKQKLNWFALFVNQGKGNDANAKLTADIDMDGITAFPGIGNQDHNFAGTFDGQRHKISNLVMNWDQQGVGLINRATNGVHVMNLTIDATCSFTGKEGVAAFIGGTYGNGGSFSIEECGNEATVNATSKNAGAFLGCNYANADSRAQFLNCYNTGAINSTAEGGAFSGWAHKAFTMTNCYNTGALSGCEGFARGYEQVITNCWSTSNSASGTYGRAANNEITDITDGTVFAALFDAAPVWHMDFAATPAHPVLYDVALVLDENFPNRFVDQENATLTLKRTTVADTWNTFCAPFALTAAQIADVFGTDAKVAELTGAEGETMNFTTVDDIEAGKAYLVKPTSAITEKELTGVNLVAGAPVATTQAGYAFTGIYEPTLIPEGDLFVAADNKLQPSDGEGKLKGFRAYFQKQGEGARFTKFAIDGGISTGIIGIDGTVVESGNIYTIGGQRVSQPTRGLYIVNGKKVVMQ